MNPKENNPILTILVGAPGSGKSTYAKNAVEKTPNCVRVCPDDNRALLGWGEGDQSVSAAAFEMAKTQVRNALQRGQNVIFDATNMYQKARKDFIRIGRNCNAKVVAVVFEQTKDTLIERNKQRGKDGGRNVPEEVIDKMLSRYQRPSNCEFDEIIFINKLS